MKDTHFFPPKPISTKQTIYEELYAVLCSLAQSCPALWRVARQTPLSMNLGEIGESWGFSKQEHWTVLPLPPPEVFPNPRIESRSPALQTHSWLFQPPGKPIKSCILIAEVDDLKLVAIVQSLNRVRFFLTLWIPSCQAFLSFIISRGLLKLMSIQSVIPSSHLILCQPLLLPSVFSSIRVFSSEATLHIRWPKYWSFSFSITPSNEWIFRVNFL